MAPDLHLCPPSLSGVHRTSPPIPHPVWNKSGTRSDWRRPRVKPERRLPPAPPGAGTASQRGRADPKMNQRVASMSACQPSAVITDWAIPAAQKWWTTHSRPAPEARAEASEHDTRCTDRS
jgi:hypothetical protein